MSYNGSGTFVINSAGTPYVSGTVISSTAANALNNDLATGLTTAITKDGQTTPTANIPLGGFKITNLGAGTVASDAARLSQVQNSTTTTLISITGTDTLTGTVSPTLTAYSTGQVFSWVVASTNTGAVTLNVDSIGVKAVTRTGSVALVAGDMVTGQVAVVEYDGTRFQLINGNSFTNLKASGTLGVTGATTLSSTLGVTGATTLSSTLGVTGAATLSSTLGVTGATTLSSTLAVTGVTTVAAGSAALPSIVSTTGTADTGMWFPAADTIAFSMAGTERARFDSIGNLGIATTSPATDPLITVQAAGGNGQGGIRLLSNNANANQANYVAYGRRNDGNGSGGFAPGALLARVNSAPAAIGAGIALGRIGFGGSYDGTDASVVYGAEILGVSGGAYSVSSAATDIVFLTTAGGTAGIPTSSTSNFGTERMRIASGGSVSVVGALSKGSGSFRIEHPLPEKSATHQLVHSFIEGPQADLIYRGKVMLVDGKASLNIDTKSTMTEGTFEVLCREVQCFTTNETGWTAVRGKVAGNILTIEAKDADCTDEISWMVIGERQDPHMMETEWTDDNGKVIVEPLKPVKQPTTLETA